MSEDRKSGVGGFVAERWVSWAIELLVLSVIAYFTISETRKTAEQTREMLTKYDAAISKYASEKTKVIDSSVSTAVDATKNKVQSITTDDVKNFIKDLKKADPEE